MDIAATQGQASGLTSARVHPGSTRIAFVLLAAGALAMGFLATDADTNARALAEAGPELTMLLRAMAGLKAGLAAFVTAVIVWRLGSPASPQRLIAYGVAVVLMMASPGLIWTLAHVGLGAAMLHGGLLMAILLLWRDQVIGERLGRIIIARRTALRRG